MLGIKGRQRETRGECRNVNFFCGPFLAVQWEHFLPCFFFITKHGIGHSCTLFRALYFSIFFFFCRREIGLYIVKKIFPGDKTISLGKYIKCVLNLI